jgi:hypothetical protein
MAKVFSVGSNMSPKEARMQAAITRPLVRRVVDTMDHRLGLKLDIVPSLRDEISQKILDIGLSRINYLEELICILKGPSVPLKPLNKMLEPVGYEIVKVAGFNRLNKKIGPEGLEGKQDAGLLKGVFSPQLVTAEGFVLPGSRVAPGIIEIAHLSDTNINLMHNDPRGSGGDLRQLQEDAIKIIKNIIDINGRDARFTKSDIIEQYRTIKRQAVDETQLGHDIDKVLLSLQQSRWIYRTDANDFLIFDQARVIQDITRIFMDEAEKPENRNLYSLNRLFVKLLNSVYTNVDLYLFNDSTRDEFLLIERTTGLKELSSFFPDWKRDGGKTKEQMNRLFLNRGQVIREINLAGDVDFVEAASHDKDKEVFVDPNGSMLAGVLAVKGVPMKGKPSKKGTMILGAVHFSNLTPKAEFRGADLAGIIGDEVNPPVFGRWVTDESSVHSALVNYFNQMASRMNKIFEDSNAQNIRQLWERTLEDQRKIIEQSEKPSAEALRAFMRSLPGVMSKKTFRIGDKEQTVRIRSILKPGNLDHESKKLLTSYLENASRRAFMQKKGVEVVGYGKDFVEKHFLNVDNLMLAVDRNMTDVVAFAGLNEKAFEVELDPGEKVWQKVQIVESIMVMPDYQDLAMGPYMMYKLLLEAFLQNNMNPIVCSLRTAVPRAYAALLRAFPDSVYPSPKRPLIDPANATREQQIQLKLMRAVSEHINPGREFDPVTGVVRGVYSDESGLKLTPDRILWERKDPEVNEFLSELLHFDREKGNVEGNALIPYFVGDAEARTEYEKTKGLTLSSSISNWFQMQVIKFLRKKG